MPNVNDVYRISVVAKMSNGEPIINTFYYRIGATGAGDEKAALATAFQGAGQAYVQLLTNLPTTYVVAALAVQPVKPVGTVELITPGTTTGAAAGNTLPGQVACVVTRKTATPGKGGRGRIFVGPIPLSSQSAADPGLLSGTVNMNAFANSLATQITSGGWTFVPVLWKRKTLTSLDLTGATMNPLFKTRRSRAEGTRFHRRKRHTVGSI